MQKLEQPPLIRLLKTAKLFCTRCFLKKNIKYKLRQDYHNLFFIWLYKRLDPSRSFNKNVTLSRESVTSTCWSKSSLKGGEKNSILKGTRD